MAAENKLSDKAVRTLLGKPTERQRTISDGRGLSIRVSTCGAVSFVFFFRIGGRGTAPKWLTLGRYPDMTLKMARDKRDECRRWLADGKDPRIQLKLSTELTMHPVTVKDAIDYWYENYAKEHRKSIQKLYSKYVNHIFPYIGRYPLTDCRLIDWLKCFDRFRKISPVQAATMLIELKQIFKYCRVRQYARYRELDDLGVNDIGRAPSKRERLLDSQQIADVWEAYFYEKGHNRAGSYRKRMFVLCLVFGCRLSEVRLSTWDEWDLKKWLWTVPAEHSKTGVVIIRPVPVRLRQWIVNLHGETKRKSVILGILKKADVVSADGCLIWQRFKHEQRWSLHDLRRTFSTNLNDMGVDFHVVEQLLGHALPGVSGTYNRSKYLTQKLDALNRWVLYLDELVGVETVVKTLKKKEG